MVLVIVGLLCLLCMLYSSLGCSNNLLYPIKELGICLTLTPSANHSNYGVS